MTATIVHVVSPERDTATDPATGAPSAQPVPRRIREPRSMRQFGPSDAIELGASVAAGIATAWLVFFQLLPLTGVVGFVLQAYVATMAIYAVVQYQRHGSLAARDRIVTAIVGTVGAAVIAVLGFIILSVVVLGLEALRANFFTQDLADVGPYSTVNEGGALHSIVGSFEQVGIAVALSVPLAIGTAVFLNEVRGRFAPVVRTFVTAMSGLPSILAGLFVAALWLIELGNRFSGFAGALALSVMMMPSVTRTTEEVLRLVPGGLREASLALGAPRWRSTLRVVLPTARTGLLTAVLLGTARAVGEAAPLLNTTFGSTRLNVNPFSGPQDSLPFLIWQSYRSPSNTVVARGWTAALVLMTIVLVLFATARFLATRRPRTRRSRPAVTA